MVQTRKQRISGKILGQVQKIKDSESDANQKKYGTMAHRLPILVHSAGLVQALAFVQAKKKNTKAWGKYIDDLALTLGKNNGDQLFRDVQGAPLKEYMTLTHQVNEALVWYKRFAESILKVEAKDANTDEAEGEE